MAANTLTALGGRGDEYDRRGYGAIGEAQLAAWGPGEVQIRHLGRQALAPDMGFLALNRMPVTKEFGIN